SPTAAGEWRARPSPPAYPTPAADTRCGASPAPVSLIPARAGRGGHLRLHHLAQHHLHRLTQDIGVLLHQQLARRRPHGHALIVGHRGAPLVSALVRNTDDPTSPRWPTPTTEIIYTTLRDSTGPRAPRFVPDTPEPAPAPPPSRCRPRRSAGRRRRGASSGGGIDRLAGTVGDDDVVGATAPHARDARVGDPLQPLVHRRRPAGRERRTAEQGEGAEAHRAAGALDEAGIGQHPVDRGVVVAPRQRLGPAPAAGAQPAHEQRVGVL